MANHPNRGKFKSPAARPPPQAIAAARKANRMSQKDAADLVYATERAWRAWEDGDRPMHPAIWELFKVKTYDSNVMRLLGLLRRDSNPTLASPYPATPVVVGLSIAFRGTSSPRQRWVTS